MRRRPRAASPALMMRLLPLLFLPAPLWADIALIQPIDCTLDADCYLQQFVDHAPGDAVSDFACGTLTYDGHQGTDYALTSLAQQAAGVDVRAAADGTVRGVRDGMPDILQSSPDAPDVSDRECGNGVLIAHADGYETQYCHMAKGSISVSVGQAVTAGTVIGQVGLSGRSEFPHLHLSVRRNGETVDPFAPDGAITCGAPAEETLWKDLPATPPGGIISAGFSIGVPEFSQIKAGPPLFTALPTDAPAMVVWSYMFGSRQGDVATITITGPDGDVIAHRETLDRTQAQLFRAAGRRVPEGGWPAGSYTATVTMEREDTILDSQTVTLDVLP